MNISIAVCRSPFSAFSIVKGGYSIITGGGKLSLPPDVPLSIAFAIRYAVEW